MKTDHEILLKCPGLFGSDACQQCINGQKEKKTSVKETFSNSCIHNTKYTKRRNALKCQTEYRESRLEPDTLQWIRYSSRHLIRHDAWHSTHQHNGLYHGQDTTLDKTQLDLRQDTRNDTQQDIWYLATRPCSTIHNTVFTKHSK